MADEGLNIYDEIEIEDMTFDPNIQIYTYPCPCGDRFEIAIDDLRDGEEIAVCPSCSLMIRVIFDVLPAASYGCSSWGESCASPGLGGFDPPVLISNTVSREHAPCSAATVVHMHPAILSSYQVTRYLWGYWSSSTWSEAPAVSRSTYSMLTRASSTLSLV
ncbi:hypothetical protein PENCOP_c003G00254 [Penicillium coprophilum]|uniref:Diphthamide biosynthesis protein 3 n=1 Tax=Penicillium coprophilum TaxID=36646 RepID=A0A1V6UXC3_9EURO|nr:hypothetical protein PENCOP_c003G00254 [Penicillium coprophilum]